MTQSPAPFAYFGAKARLIPYLHNLIPRGELYIEPFAGSATILLSRLSWGDVEILNDINQYVTCFFRALRDEPDYLIQSLHLTPYGRDTMREAQEYFKSTDPLVKLDYLETARQFFVVNQMSFSGTKRGFRYKLLGSNVADEFRKKTDRLYAIAERLSHVIIENLPATRIIKKYNSLQTVFYCDPPYLLSSTNFDDMTRVYQGHSMNEEEHEAMLNVLLQCQGAIVLSGFAHPLYDRLLAGWERVEISLINITNNTEDHGQQHEVIWRNQRAVDMSPPRLL